LQEVAGAVDIAEQLGAAFASRDADRLAALFAEDYDSTQPAHPDRAFVGREQVRTNWAAVFAGVPDFTAELVGASGDGAQVWTEWAWRGTRTDGSALEMAGVIVLGLADGLIAWARLYVEDVDPGAGIDAAVQGMAGG
jgi:ketosteroid isomerase-like protein